MSESDGIDTVLRHLGSGHDLQEFPGTTTQKLGLIRTARARRLIAWNKARGRYELTLRGWHRMEPRQGLGLAPLLISATIGAAVGAYALTILWPSAEASRYPVGAGAIVPVSEPVVAHVGRGTPAPKPQFASTLPAAPPVQSDLPPQEQSSARSEPVKLAEPPVPQEASAAATATPAKQTASKRHRHHKTSRARTRRMWAWAYRDERYPRFR